jgi:hypothetical protein
MLEACEHTKPTTLPTLGTIDIAITAGPSHESAKSASSPTHLSNFESADLTEAMFAFPANFEMPFDTVGTHLNTESTLQMQILGNF